MRRASLSCIIVSAGFIAIGTASVYADLVIFTDDFSTAAGSVS
jgi:hypothetical protein